MSANQDNIDDVLDLVRTDDGAIDIDATIASLRSRPMASPRHRLEAARLLANEWLLAAVMQKDRLLEGHIGPDGKALDDAGFREHIDFRFFVDALRRVRHAAELTLHVTNDQDLRNSLCDFDVETRYATGTLRNMIEHHDKYLEGKGRSVSPNGPVHFSELWTSSIWRSESDFVFTQAGIAVSVADSLEACRCLVRQLKISRKSYLG